MYIIKKDGTKDPFNVEKVVKAVNKSAERVLYTFSEEEISFICRFVTEKCEATGVEGIHIAQMHNFVEGALDEISPIVAKSYRDYRNYKTDFVQMLDTVYKKSQSIMYIGDKENSNADSAL
ncbi:MAG: anaerobic ribonucleoside-triphosphate reductase, partial [Clostridia bacterium]|nr:anaerobic ribonucleoside-triphosphate reductase [Clostridia bacterium]